MFSIECVLYKNEGHQQHILDLGENPGMRVGRKTYSIENTLYKRVKPRACVRSVFESHTHINKTHTICIRSVL